MIDLLLRWVIPAKGAFLALLVAMLVISSLHAGYVGAEKPDLTDREPCEWEEKQGEIEEELGDLLGPGECDPDDPAHDRADPILEITQRYVVSGWYEVGQVLAGR